MEVQRSNYLQIFPEIREKLKTADFVSFDAEYTGLKCDNGETTSLFDNTAERYVKLRKVVLNNCAPQFGIAIFTRIHNDSKDSTKQLYLIDAYSCYVAEPCFAGFNMRRTKASVEIDCCQFLNGIHFNFAEWLRNSVPFLNGDRTQELVKYLDENPDFMEKCKKDERPLENVYFPEKTSYLTETQKEQVVHKLRGFATIVDVISQQKIPVVGHNMILDLMYFFHQFCSDLPEDYSDFKAQVPKFLPVIFDTKYMTVRSRRMLDHPSLTHTKDDIAQLRCSGLYIIYQASCVIKDKFSPKFILAEGSKYFEPDLERGKSCNLEEMDSSTLCHQPSFDACVTGIVFLNLAHIACRMSKEFLECDQPPCFKEVLFSVRHWQNQLFIARASVMTMCLRGDDPKPKGCWLKISSKHTINGNDIINLYTKLQRRVSGIDWKQINANEVLLAVARVQCAKEMNEELEKKGFQVTRTLVPWDKKRLETVASYKTDEIYDTRRDKFFV